MIKKYSTKMVVFILIYICIFLLKIPQYIINSANQKITIQAVCYTMLLIIGISLFKKTIQSNFHWIKLHKFKSLLILVAVYLADVLLSSLGYGVVEIFFSTLNITPDNFQNDTNILNTITLINPVIILAILAFIGPIVEEFFFRGILITKFSTKIPVGLAVLLSSSLFAATHIHNLYLTDFIQSIPYFLSGLVFGFSYYKTKNLILISLVHIFMNLISLLPFFLT
ncbi:lysostaphin resistance A-like protein [Enterococcus sp. LJL90]